MLICVCASSKFNSLNLQSEIKLNEIFVALGYMSEQLIGEHGSQLKEIFIGYLKVLSVSIL